MGACEKPVVAANLFFGEVGAGHGHDCTPLAFDEAVISLLVGGSGDDRGVLRTQPSEDGAAYQLFVEIGVKAFWNATCFGPEILEGCDNACGRQAF